MHCNWIFGPLIQKNSQKIASFYFFLLRSTTLSANPYWPWFFFLAHTQSGRYRPDLPCRSSRVALTAWYQHCYLVHWIGALEEQASCETLPLHSPLSVFSGRYLLSFFQTMTMA